MTEQSKETTGQANEPTSTGSADPAPRSETPSSSGLAVSSEKQKATRRKKMLLGGAGVVVLAAVLVVGIPWIREALNTVSTDDAYVNGHVTFVAARVRGQVARVLVDDNNRVRRGDLLVELDKEPYQTAVAIKKAAVDTAEADLKLAIAMAHGIEADARSRYWKLQLAMEDVDNQIAELHARVAGVDKSKAALTLAKPEFDRAMQLWTTTICPGGVRSPASDPGDRARTTGSTLADVYRSRVLGLPPPPWRARNLAKCLRISTRISRCAASAGGTDAERSSLGVIHSYNLTPKEMMEEFYKPGSGDVDRTYARLAGGARRQAGRGEAAAGRKRDLDQAELILRYCDVVAEIDGVVTRRNVNPGNNVQAGQSLWPSAR